jgi:hypothetical protein
MPRVEIMTSTETPKKYVEPHERKDGPWDEYELEDAGRHMEVAEKIKANPKMVEAVAKHHEKKAKRHKKIASGMRHHMSRGLVSDKAMHKFAEANSGAKDG